ncbi:hypothetical protein BH10ACT3_BH10ACT3_20890 [soil metagenome]
MSGRQQFPPVGDPARLDAILQHGRTLRRRRRAVLTSGAGAVVLVVVVGVLIAGGTSSEDDNLIAGRDESATSTSESTTTTTAAPDQMTVDVSSTDAAIQVVVHDPVTPVAAPDSDPAQQCVLLTITDGVGATIAEGFQCTPAAEDQTPVPVQLDVRLTSTAIGCAAVITRGEAVAGSVSDASSTFKAPVPDGIAPGDYQLKVTAVSGIGDGCEGSDPDAIEVEHLRSETSSLSIP